MKTVNSLFTFHNVSINSAAPKQNKNAEKQFTFHNVSINSATGSAAQQAETQYLHSIMYLLILAIMVYFFAL